MSGIKGLQGVVRKTVNDELQANIWDPQHMDKIVPSLLFNLQNVEETERWVLAAAVTRRWLWGPRAAFGQRETP